MTAAKVVRHVPYAIVQRVKAPFDKAWVHVGCFNRGGKFKPTHLIGGFVHHVPDTRLHCEECGRRLVAGPPEEITNG